MTTSVTDLDALMDEVLAIDVDAVLAECRRLGITLNVSGARLIAEGPQTAEADRIIDRLALVKSQAIARLAIAQNSHNSQNSPTRDPRPDLANDSQWWGWLLKLAVAEYGDDPDGVAGALHFVRCGGAELRNEGGRLRIAPRYAPKVPIVGDNGEPLELADETAWADEAEWQRTRAEVLAPHREAITRLTRRVSELSAEMPV